MNKRITEAFAKGKAFIPFITCGDPSLDITEKIVYAIMAEVNETMNIGQKDNEEKDDDSKKKKTSTVKKK